MKIVIMSDTHMPKKGRGFPSQLIEDLESSDLIIHAGDFQTIEVYNSIMKYGDLIGVVGNVDDEKLQAILPKRQVIELFGVKIGIVHGDGKGKTTEKRAMEAFIDEQVDIIIFGHSHIPYLRYTNGILLFNPGSPTDKRKLPFFSYGILTMEKGWRMEHIFFY